MEPRGLRLASLIATIFLGLGFAIAAASPGMASSVDFPDVPTSHPYYSAITDLAARGVLGGYPDGRFGPDDPVTRQQFAKLIVLAAGYPVSEADVCPFDDVTKGGPGTLYPDNYVAVCAAKGITTGKTATRFEPYSAISRYQVVSMVVRTADDLRPELLASPPPSFTSTGNWPKDATHGTDAARAEYAGLLSGLPLADLDPYARMTRGEVAQVLDNLVVKLAEPLPSDLVGLTVTATEGSGTVAVNPAQSAYTKGEAVTLSPTPAAGYTFVGWHGDASGSADPLTLIMDSDKSVTALFAPLSPGYESLGGYITSAPAVCSQTSGMLDVFARGSDGHLLHLSGNGTTWSEWEDLGGDIKAGTDPAAVSWGLGRLDVFVHGSDDALWHIGWDGTTWSQWESLGGVVSAGPAAAYQNLGGGHSLSVFVVDSDNQLRRKAFDGTTWSSWLPTAQPGFSMPDPKVGFAPAAVTWGARRIDLFMYGTDGALWHNFLGQDGTWYQWEQTPGTVPGPLTAAPAASTWGSWAEDRMDVFVRGADNGIWHRTMVSGLWSSWESLGGGVVASAPAAVSWGVDRIDLFVRGTDDELWHKASTGIAWAP
jgi:uncharacterized repeat protein (TIGR02543 family)